VNPSEAGCLCCVHFLGYEDACNGYCDMLQFAPPDATDDSLQAAICAAVQDTIVPGGESDETPA